MKHNVGFYIGKLSEIFPLQIVFPCGFILHFPNYYAVKHVFLVLIISSYTSFVKCLQVFNSYF